MAFMTQLKPRSMVLYVFRLYPGELLSVNQIQEKILQHFEYNICRKTIVEAIREGRETNDNIVEKVERRNIFKHPVRVYTTKEFTPENK